MGCGPVGKQCEMVTRLPANSFNRVHHVLVPPACFAADDVVFNGTAYIASYDFVVDPAWYPPQRITFRYFICLYSDDNGVVSQRSGASIDVVSSGAGCQLAGFTLCGQRQSTQHICQSPRRMPACGKLPSASCLVHSPPPALYLVI